jgi:general secretion pathway protein G
MFFDRDSHASTIRRRRAFSLVELMVVIVIIGLLSTVVTISVRSYLITSKQNVAKMEIAKIASALDTFFAQHDRYPSTNEGLKSLVEKSEEFPEGLLTTMPVDPWGEEYDYICPAGDQPYEVVSYGADHREGGQGADSDLSSKSLARKTKP